MPPLVDTLGLLRPAEQIALLKTSFRGRQADIAVISPDAPVAIAGDWDGDGIDTLGFFQDGYFLLASTHGGGTPAAPRAPDELRQVAFGAPGDQPLAGDWDGDGTDTVGTFRDGVFRLHGNGASPDRTVHFGSPGDRAIAGDWDGDGVSAVGIQRPSTGQFHLSATLLDGAPAVSFAFGLASDLPVVGDWDGDGIDTIGVFREGTFFLRNANTTGPSDRVVILGSAGDLPLGGRWR